jgi:hypothetical protein
MLVVIFENLLFSLTLPEIRLASVCTPSSSCSTASRCMRMILASERVCSER